MSLYELDLFKKFMIISKQKMISITYSICTSCVLPT